MSEFPPARKDWARRPTGRRVPSGRLVRSGSGSVGQAHAIDDLGEGDAMPSHIMLRMRLPTSFSA